MSTTETLPESLNRGSLAEVLASRTGMARSIAYEAVETLFDVIASRVAQGGSVIVTNFGSFSLIDRQSRRARNPQTGAPIHMPCRKAVKFTVSPRLLEYANSNPADTTIRKNPKGSVRK
ncbi:HU family DNA-binding protein [Streptomyces sp. NEAU-Y11]|uniref:HU family DNA-binding protein n=1 Tax=Streptomyces cucumeris TaxID=2962890 RepID=UPI0020C8CA46|nr:HU family DNA-binding protein [Streptomyces sp. NEAU-Y11]MCP9209659.1 HU family DNA-binding protein [Streptomyces sp. NEAU-Y11]